MRRLLANFIEPSDLVKAACSGLGSGERTTICLASALTADLILLDEERGRRAAKKAGLAVAGSIAALERGAVLGKVADPRSVYNSLLEQDIRFDRKLLERNLATFIRSTQR